MFIKQIFPNDFLKFQFELLGSFLRNFSFNAFSYTYVLGYLISEYKLKYLD